MTVQFRQAIGKLTKQEEESEPRQGKIEMRSYPAAITVLG